MIDRIEREAGRMDALVEELLTLHRLEAAPEAWAEDTVDLLDLLHAVAHDADFEARVAKNKATGTVEGGSAPEATPETETAPANETAKQRAARQKAAAAKS